MKKQILLVIIILCIGVWVSYRANAQPSRTVSMQVFYDELSSYGQWIEDPDYGYVWMPDAGDDFRPYFTNGYWIMTEYGNTWISNYSWGWAPFHYGRWIYNPYYGWLWVPGYEWGPAWVCWRGGGGYYGWAPLGPWFVITIGFSAYNCPDNWWVFIPHKHVHHKKHYVYAPRHSALLGSTTIINNTYNRNERTPYITGPRSDEFYAVTGSRVPLHEIKNAQQPGSATINRNTLELFRPEVSFVTEERLKPKPNALIKNLHPTERQALPVQERPKRFESAPGSIQQPRQRFEPGQTNQPRPNIEPAERKPQTPPVQRPVQSYPRQTIERPAQPAQTAPTRPQQRKPDMRNEQHKPDKSTTQPINR